MFRLLTYDLLGIGTLLLPSALAVQAGKNGMLAILAGVACGLFYCILIGWVIGSMEEGETYPAFLKRSLGKFLGTVAILFYAVHYLLLGGYTSYIFGHLMVTDLLKEQSFYWIVAGILLLAVYAIFQGIEGRARIYEILFWFLMAPLFLMLFFAARDVEVPRLFPLYTDDFQGFFRGSWYTFEVFSLGSIALFVAPFAKKKKSVSVALAAAVLFSGFTLLLLYGILQGLFGVAGISALEYPAVTLMSMIQIPGGFMERQDALMVAIWFFTVFALLSSSLFYAAENLTGLSCGKIKKVWIFLAAMLLFAVAVCCYRSNDFTKWLQKLALAFTVFVVAVPLVAGISGKLSGKGKRMVHCLPFLCSLLLLSGCSTTELENRKFPLAMGVDWDGEFCTVSYKFQELSAVADENAEPSSSGTDFFIKDKNFYTGISKYANNTNKILDYNHMKALVFSKEFVEDTKALADFLHICNKENLIARNTLLFVADQASEILSLDKNLDTAIGSYLEEMVDTREDYKLKDAVTLGDLYNDLANKEQLLLIPVLTDAGGLPAIGSYYAFYGGEPKGEIDINQAILSYLSQGKLKKISFTMEDGAPVSVNRIRQSGDFVGGDQLLYHNKLHLEVVVEREMDVDGRDGEQIKRQLKRQIESQLTSIGRELLQKRQVDINNSFYKLGMRDAKRYAEYKDRLDQYVSDLACEFEVDVVLLNEKG